MGAAWGRTPALVASLGRTIPRQWRRDGSHPHLTSLPGLASRSAGRRLAEREVAHFPPRIFFTLRCECPSHARTTRSFALPACAPKIGRASCRERVERSRAG